MGRDLGYAELALCLVIEEKIREGAPHVDADDARRAGRDRAGRAHAALPLLGATAAPRASPAPFAPT